MAFFFSVDCSVSFQPLLYSYKSKNDTGQDNEISLCLHFGKAYNPQLNLQSVYKKYQISHFCFKRITYKEKRNKRTTSKQNTDFYKMTPHIKALAKWQKCYSCKNMLSDLISHHVQCACTNVALSKRSTLVKCLIMAFVVITMCFTIKIKIANVSVVTKQLWG